MYHIETQLCTKDYKIHGSHHRILDDKEAVASFSEENLYHYIGDKVRVAIRRIYDKDYMFPKVINISDISSQDADYAMYNTCGYLENVTWSTDPSLKLEGDFVPDQEDNEYCKSILNLLNLNDERLCFEHVVDDDLNIIFIKPYIVVELNGFYGRYKYYL